MKYLLSFLLLASAAPVMASTCHYETGDVEHAMPGCPKDVEAYIGLEGNCSILPGEIDGSDEVADAEIIAQIKKLDCEHLSCKRIAIRKKYAKDPVVSKALDTGISKMNDDDTSWKTETCEKN